MKKHFGKIKRLLLEVHRTLLMKLAISLGVCLVSGFWSPLHAELVDRILAFVNDDIVTLYELNKSIKPYEARIRSLDYPPENERKMLSKIREDVLNQLIDEKLADQEIKQLNLSVDEKEIDSAIERFKVANTLTDEGLKEALDEEGISVDEYRKRIKEQILRAKLVNRQVKSKIVITQEDIRTYYESHPERYGPKKRYRLRQILMRPPTGAFKKEKAEKRKQMEWILGELKQGKPFADMARNFSEVLAEEEGRLGLFDFEELSEKLQEALRGKRAGEFTEILETDQGYQIVLIEEIVETPAKELSEASAEIEEALFQEQIKKQYEVWLSELKTKSIVKRVD